MKRNRQAFFLLLAIGLLILSCKGEKKTDAAIRTEDTQAKSLLQGIWIDSDEENVVLKVKGDTIYYPDSVSQPIKFAIYSDTLEFQSANESKYAILKQTAHIFEFKNQNGDIVKLVKSNDPSYEMQFANKKVVSVNQNKTLKSDTVVFCSNERYHSYVQVNPTRYKVYKTTYNDDGMEQESVYFDNTVHVGLFKQENKVYSKDFRKSDFSKFVPEDFLRQSILSDITLKASEDNGIRYEAELAIPDTYLSYIVDIFISTDGKMKMSMQK